MFDLLTKWDWALIVGFALLVAIVLGGAFWRFVL